MAAHERRFEGITTGWKVRLQTLCCAWVNSQDSLGGAIITLDWSVLCRIFLPSIASQYA